MILSDPLFERSHYGKHYALILKLECPEVMPVIAIIGLFRTVFSKYLSEVFLY